MGEESEPHPHRWAMLAGVWMVYFCFGSTAAAIAPLVSRITAELQLSHTQMGSILGAWQLVYICAAIPCGALLDRIGPRRGLALGALVVAISGILRGVATNYITMLLAVGAFGIGGPLVSVGAPTVIRDWFAGREPVARHDRRAVADLEHRPQPRRRRLAAGADRLRLRRARRGARLVRDQQP
jgi:MFS transporter, CP family, cyanate transporter